MARIEQRTVLPNADQFCFDATMGGGRCGGETVVGAGGAAELACTRGKDCGALLGAGALSGEVTLAATQCE